MNSKNIHTTSFWLFFAVMALVIAGSMVFVSFPEAAKPVSPPTTSKGPDIENNDHTLTLSSVSEFLPPVELPTVSTDFAAVSFERLKPYAREKRLPIVDPESLTLDSFIIELLKLTPTEVEGINECFRDFMEDLRSNELAHAFVREGPNGNEEIVVSAFDRSSLIERFRDELSAKGNCELADFLADQIPFDTTLAVANSEISVAIETGSDGGDRVSFSRRIQRPEAKDDKTPMVARGGIFGDVNVRLSPTDVVTTQGLLGNGISPRLRHLFAAASSLPRRSSVP